MILINGIEAGALAATDRGLHYGDGLFETLAVSKGIPELWQQHLGRLQHSCQRLNLPMPDLELLRCEAKRVCSGADQAVLKLILTRGSGGRGYRPPLNPQVTRILSLYPWPDYPQSWWQQGILLGICRQRVSLNPSLAGLKHLNRLDQVLARAEWDHPDQAEGLMLDSEDRIIEGTMSNLFALQDGCLLTPDLSRAGVKGIMRDLILAQTGELGMAVQVTDLSLSDLARAQELFLCNSLIGIWPVRCLQGLADYPAPGPYTASLMSAIAEARVS